MKKNRDDKKVKDFLNLLFKLLEDERVDIHIREEYIRKVEEIVNG